jgi:hypothetical protein
VPVRGKNQETVSLWGFWEDTEIENEGSGQILMLKLKLFKNKLYSSFLNTKVKI